MPVRVRKKKGRKCYEVRTPNMVHAKCTTKRNARAQERILNAYEKTGWRPTGRKARRGM